MLNKEYLPGFRAKAANERRRVLGARELSRSKKGAVTRFANGAAAAVDEKHRQAEGEYHDHAQYPLVVVGAGCRNRHKGVKASAPALQRYEAASKVYCRPIDPELEPVAALMGRSRNKSS